MKWTLAPWLVAFFLAHSKRTELGLQGDGEHGTAAFSLSPRGPLALLVHGPHC